MVVDNKWKWKGKKIKNLVREGHHRMILQDRLQLEMMRQVA